MKHLCPGCEFFRISHHTIRKPCAQRNQQITLTDAQVRRFRAMHTDHARIQLVLAVKSPLAHQGIADRRINLFRKGPHFFTGAGQNGAAAQVNIGTFRFPDQIHCRFHVFLRIFLCRGKFFRCPGFILTQSSRHIFCNVHQYRAGPS